MTPKERAAMQQALEALKDYHKADDDRVSVAMSILQEALAEQAEQEPVAWIELLREARDNCKASIVEEGISAVRKEYRIDLEARLSAVINAAHVRTKDLTDDEVAKAYMECTGGDIIARCRAVIAADRRKNK